ncbi:MAG TPA: TetR/AcrR family transcriptional regulator, partial [Solirubrobacteraceae bacterium]|nr:TetR/AcrR family transcriptional regulator [Solirubrobacteraceae bacterium]
MAVRDRYRRLPSGVHGLDPQAVKDDQRSRLRAALTELIVEKGYQAVRMLDIAKRAHVSQPTFYRLFDDKEDLFLSTYDEIARRAGVAVVDAYCQDGRRRADDERVLKAMRAFADLAVQEPGAMSLLMLGAFGGDGRALARRRRMLELLESTLAESRGGGAGNDGDLTIKAVLGGIREVTATRLREHRERELPDLTAELAHWASCYPRRLPSGLSVTATPRRQRSVASPERSDRARRAEAKLPSGRSDMPRLFIVKSQRERIVDATAAIVAEKGLAALTVPEIARRASVSLQTFYTIYASKHEAFLGAQKVGMHQALQVASRAYGQHGDDWPAAVAAGICALCEYLASEQAHAHLNLV